MPQPKCTITWLEMTGERNIQAEDEKTGA